MKYQIQEKQEWLMRVIRTEFSSLHLCSLTFSRPLRTLFSFCLRPVLDERLMTSIRGLRLLIRFQISMNSHLEVIFISIKITYIKIFYFKEWLHFIYKGCNLSSNNLESPWFISTDSPQTDAWKWRCGFPEFSRIFLPLAGISRAAESDPSHKWRCAVRPCCADCVWLDPPTSGPSSHRDLLRKWKLSRSEYCAAAGTFLMLKTR